MPKSETFFERFAELDAAAKGGVTPSLLAQVDALADEGDALVALNEISAVDAEAVWCFRDEINNTDKL